MRMADRSIRVSSALLVGLLAAIVLVGHVWELTFLTSISSHWVTMKPNTALGFLACAFIALHPNERASQQQGAVFLAAVMITQIFQYFAPSDNGDAYTVGENAPSMMTIANFLIIAIWGWFRKNACLTCIVMNCSVALLGYALDWPLLYFYIDGISTAMAVHTAVCFIAIAIAIDFKHVKDLGVAAIFWLLFYGISLAKGK